jgi:YesN/AraC family two-component response regulator
MSFVALQLRADNHREEEIRYMRRLMRENKADSLLSYIDGILSHSQPGKEEIAFYHSVRSSALLSKGKFNESLQSVRFALANASEVKDSAILSEIWKTASHSYNRNGQLDSALFYTRLFYDYARRANDSRMVYSALVSLGNIHLQNKQFQLSLEFYQEALNMTLANGAKENLPIDYYNLGLAQFNMGLLEPALVSLSQSAELGLQQKNLRLVARAYGSIADIKGAQNRLNEQLNYLKKANQLAAQLQDKRLLAMGCSNLMHHHLKRGDFEKAIEYGSQGLDYLREQPMIQLEIRIDSMMYTAYKSLNQPEKAIRFHEAYTKLNNKLRNEEVTLRLNELKSLHEIEKKNLTIKNQTIELLAAQRSGRINLLIISVLTILLLFLAVFYFREGFYKKILFKKEKETDFQIEILRNRLESQHISQEIPDVNDTDEDEETGEIIPKEKSQQMFNRIMDMIEAEKMYLMPDLDQKYIVKLLGTNRRYVYEAVALHGDQNFKGLINRLRVNESKRVIRELLAANKEIDLSSIYTSAGFNSKSSFYRTFKSVTGLPPGDYVAQLEREMAG